MNAVPTTRRWFVPTPSWLVFCLLASTGVLYLSQQFQWFAFNHHKGWAVLFAVACVGVFFVAELIWLAAALVFRLRFQSSIRSLLLLTLVAALPFSWLATDMRKAREQRALVEELRNSGCNVSYWQGPLGRPPVRPEWLQDLLGVDFFFEVVGLDFNGPKFTNVDLERLKGMPQLLWLVLSKTEVTDVGLKHLKGLKHLIALDLRDTKVTDAGLEHLKDMAQLEYTYLDLDRAKVTDAGEAALKRKLPGCTIYRLSMIGLKN